MFPALFTFLSVVSITSIRADDNVILPSQNSAATEVFCEQKKLAYETQAMLLHKSIEQQHEIESRENEAVLDDFNLALEKKQAIYIRTGQHMNFKELLNQYTLDFQNYFSEERDEDNAYRPDQAVEALKQGTEEAFKTVLEKRFGSNYPGKAEGQPRCKPVQDPGLIPFQRSDDTELMTPGVRYFLYECKTRENKPPKILRYVAYGNGRKGTLEILTSNRYANTDERPKIEFFGDEAHMVSESAAGIELGRGRISRLFTSGKYTRYYYSFENSRTANRYNADRTLFNWNSEYFDQEDLQRHIRSTLPACYSSSSAPGATVSQKLQKPTQIGERISPQYQPAKNVIPAK